MTEEFPRTPRKGTTSEVKLGVDISGRLRKVDARICRYHEKKAGMQTDGGMGNRKDCRIKESAESPK